MREPFRARVTVTAFLAVIALMVGITSYSVTLYRLFCQATGAGGTTQRVAEGSTTQTTRSVTVSFDTSVAPNLPWRFEPTERAVTVHLGQDAMAFFEATNLSDHDIVGHAAFNVTPDKVGVYFKKIQCFCFNEERLRAGEHVQMPVTFFVDPAMAKDPDTADVHEITLSYTFFQSKRPEDAVELSLRQKILTTIYIDADACPVREETFRVAGRLGVDVVVVSNGSRPIRPPGPPFVRMVVVGEGPDVADDWIATRITAADVCVTSDIPLAARCLAAGARALSSTGHVWSGDNIGAALAGRAVSAHMREMGMVGGGPPPLRAADRSRF